METLTQLILLQGVDVLYILSQLFTSVCHCDHVLSVGDFETFGGTMNEILYDLQTPEKPEDGNGPTSQISQSSNTACSKPLSKSFKFIANFNLRY